MKNILIGITLTVCPVMVSGQDAARAVDLFEAGMYTAAQKHFLQHPSAEASYYLGEIAFANKKSDSAAYYYDLGLTDAAPYLLCHAGKGKLLLANDAKAAEGHFKEMLAAKGAKKNPAVYTAIGRAYAANKMGDKAMEYFAQAHTVDKTYADAYIAEGDWLMAQEKINDAANKYDMAAFLDKTNKPSRLKLAAIYTHVNPNQAVQTLEELLSVHPDYAPAYRQISELYYSKGLMGKACENFSRYISYGDYSRTDRERYAQLLFFNKDYPASLNEVNKALADKPDNGVMKRLLGYNLFETGEFAKAESAMKPFMNDSHSKLIALDHKYFARILRKNKQDSLALVHYEKASAMDTTGIQEIYKEMAQAYEALKQYATAGQYYERYIAGGGASSTDIFFCGRYFYNAGNSAAVDSTERTRLLLKADAFFETVNQRTPASYLGNFWRARVNALLDPETEQGLAKPFYEKALSILENNPEKYKGELLECYKYLGYYLYLQKENAASIAFWEKVLTLDPGNAVATEAIKGIKKQAK